MMVESVAGPSPFTNDPARHKIVEGQGKLLVHIVGHVLSDPLLTVM